MGPEENTQEVAPEKHVLHTVTPLSKYLARVLFVLMPFIGGWIGYNFAPEKIIEVEKIVLKEVAVETSSPEEKELEQLEDNKELAKNWNTYENKEFGFRIKYPKTGWQVEERSSENLRKIKIGPLDENDVMKLHMLEISINDENRQSEVLQYYPDLANTRIQIAGQEVDFYKGIPDFISADVLEISDGKNRFLIGYRAPYNREQGSTDYEIYHTMLSTFEFIE